MIKIIKNLLPLLLLGFGFFSSEKNVKISENRTIKTIRKVEYFVGSNNKILKRKKVFKTLEYEIHEYNEQGHVTKQDSYDKNGNLKNRNSFKYNAYGDQIESISISSKTGIRSYKRSNYIYDDQNKVTIKNDESGDQFKPKKSVSKTEYFYKNGNLIKTIIDDVWLGKKSNSKVLYNYNNFNKIDSTLEYIDKDYLYKKEFYKYNSEDELIESYKTIYPKQGNPEYIKEYKKYNANGKVVENIYEIHNGYYAKKLFDYNAADLKSSYQKYERDNTLVVDEYYEYKYDRYGNWITLFKKFPSSDNVWITERKLEYYN